MLNIRPSMGGVSSKWLKKFNKFSHTNLKCTLISFRMIRTNWSLSSIDIPSRSYFFSPSTKLSEQVKIMILDVFLSKPEGNRGLKSAEHIDWCFSSSLIWLYRWKSRLEIIPKLGTVLSWSFPLNPYFFFQIIKARMLRTPCFV